eukprot:1282788-Rhodomonas_salina.3
MRLKQQADHVHCHPDTASRPSFKRACAIAAHACAPSTPDTASTDNAHARHKILEQQHPETQHRQSQKVHDLREGELEGRGTARGVGGEGGCCACRGCALAEDEGHAVIGVQLDAAVPQPRPRVVRLPRHILSIERECEPEKAMFVFVFVCVFVQVWCPAPCISLHRHDGFKLSGVTWKRMATAPPAGSMTVSFSTAERGRAASSASFDAALKCCSDNAHNQSQS